MLQFRLVVHFLASSIIGLAEAQLSGSETPFDARIRTPTGEPALPTARSQKPSGNYSVRFDGNYEYATGERERSADEGCSNNRIRVGTESKGQPRPRSSAAALAAWLRIFSSDSPWRRLFSSDSPWQRLLRALDRAILADSVRIADGVFLVKDVDEEHSLRPAASRESDEEWEGEEGTGFGERLLRRLIVLLETHAIRMRLGTMASPPGDAVGRIGGGHGYRHAFPLMVGSFALLAAFFVPIGFQLLAVVAGKALVLSQIAVVVAVAGSIQRYLGLRGTNYNYGLPTGVVEHEYHHHQLGGGGGGLDGGYWHRAESNPEPLEPSRLRAYFDGSDDRPASG